MGIVRKFADGLGGLSVVGNDDVELGIDGPVVVVVVDGNGNELKY
jgi:hypothetical protein